MQGPVGRAGTEAAKHFGRSFGHGIRVAGKAIGVGIAAGLGLAVAAAVKLIPVLRQSVQGYRDHLQVVAQTTAAIRSTGGAAQVSVKHVNNLTDALERKTTVDGDVIQTGANMLLTFTNVRNEVGKGNAIFDRATATVTDMSVALGQDTKNSAIQLGKALNDPIRGVTALQRVGVTFTASQRDQIKALVESGHRLEAQKIILAELNKEFGGSAAAQVTASGRMQVAWHQLQDTIGSILLPVVDRFENTLGRRLIPDLNVLATRYGPGLRRILLGWVDGFNRTLPSTRELSLGLRALGLAFEGNGITTSSDKFVGKMERLGVTARRVIDWFKTLRPEFSQIGSSASALGPALAQAGGGGHVFANALTVVAPVLDVVARNMHNILPWLPVLVAGFLAFRGVRTAIRPVSDLAATVRNFVSPATAAATFLNARAQKALAAAMREQAAAAVESAGANRAAATAVAASGTAAGGAAVEWGAAGAVAATSAGKWQLLASALGIVGAALVVGDIVDRLTSKLGRFQHAVEFALGPIGLLGVDVGGLKRAWQSITGAQDAATGSTRVAATVAERHAAAVRGERDAITSLKAALAGEKSAELDVRQAKLNVSSAQKRLTDLTRDGHKGSLEYRQAQIDLRRAQIDLKARTDDYRAAQAKANTATGGAMHASIAATPPLRHLGEAAQTGGQRAGAARIPWAKLGERVALTYSEIHSKTAQITAKFGWKGLEVFRTGGGGLGGGGKAFAAGGRVTAGTGPTADDVLIRASRGETVVSAADSSRPEFRAWAGQRGIPGYATGGRVPVFSMRGDRGFTSALGDWDLQVGKVLDLAATRFKRLASRFGANIPHVAGAWKIATNFLTQLGIPYSIVSTFRPGARTHASGRVSFHALNRAVDLDGGHDKMRIWSALTRTNPTELIYSRAPRYKSVSGWHPIGRLDPITRADHYSHVHAAYDQGGWLMPGTTVAHNATNKPERVLPPGGAVELAPTSRRALARDIADEMVRAGVGATYLDSRRAERILATAAVANSRRG